MRFSETCMTVPAAWTVDADALRSALNWWAGCYRDGCRITLEDGQYTFTQAMMPWRRLETFGRFGRFPETAPVAAPAGIEAHDEALRLLLSQKAPNPLAPYFFHLLDKAYELDPIEDWAGQNSHKIHGIGTQGGYFLVNYGRRREAVEKASRRKLAELPPILAKYKPLAI